MSNKKKAFTDMPKYPIKPEVLYNENEKRGLHRLNRRLIEQSNNVIEFEPFIFKYVYDTYGVVDLEITHDFWVRNGYRHS